MRNRLWMQGLQARPQGLAGRIGVRSYGGGGPTLMQIVQQSRQKHLQLWRDDINSLARFADSFRGGAGLRRNAYDVQAVEGDTTTTTTDTTVPPPPPPPPIIDAGLFSIDAANIKMSIAGSTYTINGSVTGPVGDQARIRVWLGSASTGAKLLDPTYGSETLVSGNLVVPLPSGNNTFSLSIDLTHVPPNAATPPSAASPWVITASDASGNDESDPVLIPMPTAAFTIDTTTLVTSTVNGILTVTGTVREPNSSPAVLRLWLGTQSGQKLVNPTTFGETLIGSTQVALTAGAATFAVPGGTTAPTSTNPWVITACDLNGGYETQPIIVPLPSSGTGPGSSSFTIDPTSLVATPAGSAITITGTVRQASNTTATIRVWMGTSTGQKLLNPPNFGELLLGTQSVSLSSGTASFSVNVIVSPLPAGASMPTTGTPWVITASDQAGNNETLPIIVPPPGSAPAAGPAFSIDASSLKAGQSGTMVTVTGTVREPGNTATVVRLWMGMISGSQPQKALAPPNFVETVLGGASAPLSSGSGIFSIGVDLAKLPPGGAPPTGSNPWVITACDSSGNFETAPIVAPAPTLTPATPPQAPTITAPAAAGATTNNTTFPIQGSVTPSAANLIVQAWPGSGTNKSGPVAGAFFATAGNTVFTIVVPLTSNAANSFVVSATDTSSNLESPLVTVPTITQGSGTPPPPPPPPVPPPQPQPQPKVQPGDPVETVEGIGPVHAAALKKAGVHTTLDLLNAGATPSGRSRLARAIRVSARELKIWVENVDLFRLVGVAEEFADLLNEAGVDSIPELARRNPDNLHQKLVEVNEEKKLVRRDPSLRMVTGWIAQAKALPEIVQH